MKKITAVFLSVLMLFSVLAISAAAEEKTGSFSAFCYNVAGLPDFSVVTGTEERTPDKNQAVIGKYVTENGYDIFATQEDFGYHDILVKNLKGYNYATQHYGIVPFGDGTNIFTRSMPMFNEKHIKWKSLYGIIDDGADEFSQKGITYCVIEIAEGVYIDFYDIHADAYDDAGSHEARADNFVQLAELINSRTVDRPVIITGDFNEYLLSPGSTTKTTLCDGCGLKDAWIELYNNGNYDSDADYIATLGGAPAGGKWGRWDSVERFLYKDGGGITLTCDSFEYVTVFNEEGKDCSDHVAAAAVFSYTAQETPTETGELSNGQHSNWSEHLRRFIAFFKALFLAITNFDTIKNYLSK